MVGGDVLLFIAAFLAILVAGGIVADWLESRDRRDARRRNRR